MKLDLRNAWMQIHLWLGLTLGMVGILVGLTGSVLIYDHEIDALLNPQRYAVSGSELLPPGEYIAKAKEALAGKAQPVNLRFPDEAGSPVTVIGRAGGQGGARPTVMRVYLDPPTGRVLDTGEGGFVAWAHNFHESLTLRQYSGREIVGAVGIAMLISSLSGIYLWWPGRGRMRSGLTTRRGFTASRNIHYLVGFYGSLMLAMLSFTGIYLAYPDFGRNSTALFATLSPAARNIQAPEPAPRPDAKPADGAPAGPDAAKPEGKTEGAAAEHKGMRMSKDGAAKTADGSGGASMQTPATDATPAGDDATARADKPAMAKPDEAKSDATKGEGKREGARNREGRNGGAPRIPLEDAIKIAQALYPEAHLLGVGLPTGPRGVYRIGFNLPGSSLNSPGGSMVAFLDPANGNVIRRIDPAGSTAGDKYVAMMRPLHSAEGLGALWKVLYFAGGLLPAFLAITGTMMWLRGRRLRTRMPARAAGIVPAP